MNPQIIITFIEEAVYPYGDFLAGFAPGFVMACMSWVCAEHWKEKSQKIEKKLKKLRKKK